MADARPVLLIDFSALFRRAWHVQSEVSHAFESTIGGVNRAIAMLPEALVAICCDGRGNWRKEISKEYKAQRESQPQQMYGEMDRTLDRLRKDGRLIWKADGFEADDVIATAVQSACTRGHWCRIVSHDKDLLQLLSPATDYLAIHKTPWEVVTADIVNEKYGVDASQFADWLALVGDSSDNVKGCPGVGAKGATQLIQKFGTLDRIFEVATLDSAEDSGKMTPNVRKNLIMYRDQIVTARQLVSLRRDVPIRFDEIYQTRQTQDIVGVDYMDEAERDTEADFTDVPEETDQAPGIKREAESQPALNPELGPSPPATVEPGKTGTTADVVMRDKTPEEVAEVSRPVELVPIVEYSKQLEPRSLKEAQIYARLMFNSRVYSRYPTVESMTAAIVRGRELGYGAGTSLDIFHVADFNNDGNLRLILHAHVIIEHAMRDPSVEYFALVSSSATECTYEAKVKRNPQPTSLTYTIEDAKNAGLVRLTKNGQPNNWMKRPSELLRKTCGVQLGRIVAPGATIGLYCFEELGVEE